ncbi:rho GTPase-activating protein REN1 isoform X3 [Ricinus communis]|uniref:rho GTPase-activating protein REN1 isoform X3 n=1 Tax=Ricinus communis TaxID=3988 RepID=UPI00201A4FAB|nr:rho GTPase-activating protein REN1 isoform X3 [Ricinus communis]
MTTNKSVNTELSQGDGGGGGGGAPRPPPSGPPPPGHPDNAASRAGNSVFKSGPLFISSKGIGWTSWKKRWFILTRTSLVFFRSDPSAVPQKGSEVNLTLGGIDLNNSGSVVVKSDKKLLTVLFPDGRDGRAFTLKAETMEDLYDWKTALENALAQAPSAALVMGQNGIFKNDPTDCVEGSFDQCVLPVKDKVPGKAMVIGRPVLLALEDVDGTPSFLEKALRYIEEHGVKVEGILRQAAAVDDVEHRIREYEQGRTEFSAGEDAHVIADCVKYFLRELPSSPVPASCCKALLEAFRKSIGGKDHNNRVNAMREAILETFPEPNRRLLQRILLMMQNVASHKAENRMSTSAVAACMAPLLLRPLLAGDCEIENDFDVGGDGSMQLLQAAAAANHAQAIVITLLEEYDKIFNLLQEGVMSPGLYSDSEECDSEDEEVTDDDESYEDDEQDDASQETDAYTDDDLNDTSSRNESGDSGEEDLSDNKGCDDLSSISNSPEVDNGSEAAELSNSVQTSLPSYREVDRGENSLGESNKNLTTLTAESDELLGDLSSKTTLENKQTGDPSVCIKRSSSMSNGRAPDINFPSSCGRTSGRKNLSMESLDYHFDDEIEIQKLEATKIDLQHRISEEVKGNAVLQANLEQRKKALNERRLALEQDVARLQEELQKERDKRMVLEAGLNNSQANQSVPVIIDEKIKEDLEEISQAEADVNNLKQKVDNLSMQLNQQRDQNYGSPHDSNNQGRKDKERDTEASAGSYLGKSANKDNLIDESTILPNKTQQADASRSSNSRSSSNSKKTSYRSEGTNSTTSALTKLTTRLNFLKERRSQLTSEILDKGRGSSQATATNKVRGSEVRQSPQIPDKSQGSEVHSVPNPDKARRSESSQSVPNPDKGLGIEGQSHKNSEKSRKSDSHQDGGKSLESQNADKGKFDGSADKGKGSGGQPKGAQRTNSR